jgi:hypothetical protein
LDISEGTSKSQFWRAKKLLQKMITAMSDKQLFTEKIRE